MNPQEAKKLENKVLETLKKHLAKNDIIIAGVSGGPDSIFLLHCLKKFQNITPIKIIAAHVNHMLRKESAYEQNFVKTAAQSHKIPFSFRIIDIKSLSQKGKSGIEETGRKVRYDFFKELAKIYHATFIATAHHADDNLETIILNFIRGASIKGLCGMKISDPPLLRPLLYISKDQILEYLKLNKIKYCVDKSNFEQIYRRNIIRKRIIPELKKLNPSVAETIAKNAKILREIDDFLQKEAEKWLKKNSLNKNSTKLNGKSFRRKLPALQKAIILTLYKKITGAATNLENIHIKEILHLINKNIGNKKKKLGNLTFSLKNNIINIAKNTKKAHY